MDEGRRRAYLAKHAAKSMEPATPEHLKSIDRRVAEGSVDLAGLDDAEFFDVVIRGNSPT